MRSENFVFGRQKLCNFYATNLNLVLTLYFIIIDIEEGHLLKIIIIKNIKKKNKSHLNYKLILELNCL